MDRSNVTLSLPAPLVLRARHYAVDHATSLSALVAECLEERIGPDARAYLSARDRALDRMNSIHGRFKIANDDYRYVLSTFIFEPPRWIDRFGWRRMVEQERLGLYYFWRAVGQRMNIQDIPASMTEYERFNVEYEQTRFRYSDASRRTAVATRDMFLAWFLPQPLWKLGEPFVYALLDDRLLEAFGFPKPSAALRRLVGGALRTRARLVRLLPERKQPHLRSELKHRTYPQGYHTEELGPPAQP